MSNLTNVEAADEFYWAHAEKYPSLDGEQISNAVHQDIIRLASDFASAAVAVQKTDSPK